MTLFRAWYSRRNFGLLAGSSQISMHTLNARVPIGGLYGDITYPINSPLAITMGFAAAEALHGNLQTPWRPWRRTPPGLPTTWLRGSRQ